MTGRGHMVAGTAFAFGCDRLIYHLSNFISSASLRSELDTSDFNLFDRYREFISRVWYPEAWIGTMAGKAATLVEIALFVILFWIGCFLPDVDQPNSTLGKYFYIPCTHRTWTHTIWCAALFLVPGIWFPPFFWVGYAYLIHLILDAISRGGVCFFYPISKYIDYPSGAHVKKHHVFKLYSAGGASEVVVCVIIVATAIMLWFGPAILDFFHKAQFDRSIHPIVTSPTFDTVGAIIVGSR